ncbi:hypothetical protein V5735_24445 (plasmid) [Haladaptatus sp. SPP-AMP-3]|uniref:hypothetical protein n=1 Tax=Haladaptatus sp. SPP-AMP-3 TaxID=3121295 RepID=UPI003C2DB8EC
MENGKLPKAMPSQSGRPEPFERYVEMRHNSPVHFNEERQRWGLFRDEDIDCVLGDHEVFTSDRAALVDDSFTSNYGGDL